MSEQQEERSTIKLADAEKAVGDELAQKMQQQLAQVKIYCMELTERDVNLILKGCGELPTKEAFHTVSAIFAQLDIQNKLSQDLIKAGLTVVSQMFNKAMQELAIKEHESRAELSRVGDLNDGPPVTSEGEEKSDDS